MSVINRKIIARNTLMLYLRMGIVLFISLYTSRIVLDALGEVDFGIYNAVGGIVALATFVCGTLSSTCQRFFLMEMDSEDSAGLNRSFCMFLQLFVAFALIIIIVVEPLGLWFLHNKMKVAGRMAAAQWVFHFSILSFIFVAIRLPYQGMVIAREKMKVFAYVGMCEAVLSLAIAFSLKNSPADHLVAYAALMTGLQAIVTILYFSYCLRYYRECRYRFQWESSYFKNIFSYSGWSLIGASSAVVRVHGLNLLLNMFFNPVVNAARGLAFKIYGSIIQLQENFMLASKPQIMKAYAGNDLDSMNKLIWQASKFSAYLMLLLAVPVTLEINFLLGIWLKDVPQYTSIFTVLMLLSALIDYIDYPVQVAIAATGKIKWYQIVTGGIQLLQLPVAYLLLKTGNVSPPVVLYVSIFFSVSAVVAKLHFGRRQVGISPVTFIHKTIVPVLSVLLLAMAAGYVVKSAMDQGWMRLVLTTAASTTSLVISVFSFGMTSKERATVRKRIRQFIS